MGASTSSGRGGRISRFGAGSAYDDEMFARVARVEAENKKVYGSPEPTNTTRNLIDSLNAANTIDELDKALTAVRLIDSTNFTTGAINAILRARDNAEKRLDDLQRKK